MKKYSLYSTIVVLTMAMVLGFSNLAYAATPIDLGNATPFAVLAGSTITNTGSSVITGDLGLSPGSSVTGFPPGTVVGTQHVANTTALNAKTDLTNAYLDAAGQTPVTTVPTELGGTTKTAGIYSSAAGTFGITGTLTLDGQGNADAIFIFKTASTLVTAGASVVSLVNGAQACNVFWQVGSSATLGTSSVFKGNIMALTAITLTTGANVEGRVLARNAAVTLDTNVVTRPTCTTAAVIAAATVATAATAAAAASASAAAAIAATTAPATGFETQSATTSFPWSVAVSVMIGSSLFYLARKKELFSSRPVKKQ